MYKQLSQLWASAGMHARKWLSNVLEVLEHIPHADCVTEVDLDRGELPVVKTLGVLWTSNENEFKYQVHLPSRFQVAPPIRLQHLRQYTSRILLSYILNYKRG